MRTPLCSRLGIEFPIFAFSHCRDVVAEVIRAGGFGVLGAANMAPEQIAVELDWIDKQVGRVPTDWICSSPSPRRALKPVIAAMGPGSSRS
jgi:hypothetical protein